MKRKNSYNNTGLILNNRFSLMEIAREEYKQDKISKDLNTGISVLCFILTLEIGWILFRWKGQHIPDKGRKQMQSFGKNME